MENTISTGKAAKLLGVTVKTIQRWEREKRLIPIARSNTNRRLYTLSQIRSFIKLKQSGGKSPTRQERLSPEHEMVQDLMTIVHCFSSRLYGLRNYRKKLSEALKQEVTCT